MTPRNATRRHPFRPVRGRRRHFERPAVEYVVDIALCVLIAAFLGPLLDALPRYF